MREHRLVVIPSCQGTGIGVVISETIAQYYLGKGCRYFAKTSHPKLGMYRNSNPHWRPTSTNQKLNEHDRMCYSHEYVGPDTIVPITKVVPSTKDIQPTINIKSARDKFGY